MKKNIKLTPEMTENFYFQSFYAFFVKLLTDFVNWKVLKGQQGNSWLSSSLFRRVNCIFKLKRSQIDTEFNKNPKVFKFSMTLCIFFQIFDVLCGLER